VQKLAHIPRTLLCTSAKNFFYKCGKTFLWMSTKCAFTVTMSVRVSVMVRVSLVWLVSSNNLVELCIAIWRMKYITLSCTLCCPLGIDYVHDSQSATRTDFVHIENFRFCTPLRVHSNSLTLNIYLRLKVECQKQAANIQIS